MRPRREQRGERLCHGKIDSSSDYATIKYSPTGERLWAKRYDGPGNGIDDASGIAVDSQVDVYVTGNSQGAGSAGDYATIKYSQ
jgi:hypothetical protein